MENEKLTKLEILKNEIRILELENRIKLEKFYLELFKLSSLKIVSPFIEKNKTKIII